MELKAKLKEKLDLIRDKVDFEKTGAFFREKGALVLGSVLLVAVITVSVAVVGKQESETLGNESTPKYLGQSVLVDANANKEPTLDEEDYFQSAAADRKQVREEALAVLEQSRLTPTYCPTRRTKRFPILPPSSKR